MNSQPISSESADDPREILGQLNDVAAMLGVAQRSLERQEIASDEILLLRQSIAVLLAAHNRLDELLAGQSA